MYFFALYSLNKNTNKTLGPPIPVRGYDQTDIDLVNQIRISSRQLDVTTPDQSIDHDVESRRVLTGES